MNNAEEGVIKFSMHWESGPAPALNSVTELIKWRNKLFDLTLIGKTPDGIGYGNISLRISNTARFYISGTQTGGIKNITANHITEVLDFSIDRNELSCKGPVQASSESLSHAAIYLADSAAGAVIHVHSQKLWEVLIKRFPSTGKDIPYGTPQMAREIDRLVHTPTIKSVGIFAMGGHEGGIIGFGTSVTIAAEKILSFMNHALLSA